MHVVLFLRGGEQAEFGPAPQHVLGLGYPFLGTQVIGHPAPAGTSQRGKTQRQQVVGHDARLVLDGVFCIARTGAPWRDLTEDFGKWGSVYRQFRRWSVAGVWDAMLEALNATGMAASSVQMIDSTIVRAHQHAADAQRHDDGRRDRHPAKEALQHPVEAVELGAAGAAGQHHGELVAMDRSIGTLRQKLRDLGLAENTLLVFCSDNGGLPAIKPSTVGNLRGFKGSLFEGGLRVPGIIEWPAVIKQPRITQYPAGTFDIFPTLADVLGLPATVMLTPVDGSSLRPLFTADLEEGLGVVVPEV